jgi:hypothetical protein
MRNARKAWHRFFLVIRKGRSTPSFALALPMKFAASRFVLSPGIRQRVVIWAGVLAGHFLVGYALCFQLGSPAEKSVGAEGAMVSVSLVSSMEPTGHILHSPPKPAVVERETPPTMIDGLEQVAETEELASPSLSEAEMELVGSFQPASMGEPGAACNLTQQLAEAFGSSPEVRQGIATIPASGRSVANALMLWDGRWAEGTQSGGMALLRALLVKAIVSSRPECLQAQNQGPVLFLIPDNQTTVVLAIGSGQWRWADVVAPASTPDVIASIF